MKSQGFHKNYFWYWTEGYINHTWIPRQTNDWPHDCYGHLSSLSCDISAFIGWSKSFMISTSMESLWTTTTMPDWHGWTPSSVLYKPAHRSHWRSTWLQQCPFCQKCDNNKLTYIWGLWGTWGSSSCSGCGTRKWFEEVCCSGTTKEDGHGRNMLQHKNLTPD